MERPVDFEEIWLNATPVEREALRVAMMPRGMRGTLDKVQGTTPQSRCNARRRLRERLGRIGS
jgi:hypothetical protein